MPCKPQVRDSHWDQGRAEKYYLRSRETWKILSILHFERGEKYFYRGSAAVSEISVILICRGMHPVEKEMWDPWKWWNEDGKGSSFTIVINGKKGMFIQEGKGRDIS